MSAIKHKFSINFDLHTDKDSEKELSNKVGIKLSKMYDIIKDHLKDNGFEWVQGSGYITKEPISSYKLTSIIKSLYKNNIWLGHFTRDIKRTIVDDMTYSYNSILHHYDDEYKDKYYNKYEKACDEAKNSNVKDDLKERSKAIVESMLKDNDIKVVEKNNKSKGKDKGNENDGR